MKKKLLFIPILAMAIASLSACSFFGGGNNGHEVIPEANGLMIYNNPNEANPKFSGGGIKDDDPNTVDCKLKYDYDGLGDVSAMGDIDYMPTQGNVNLLVIPCEFSNYSRNATESMRQKIYNAYFGTVEDNGFESVSSYFAKSSYGALQISGVVSEWWKMPYDTFIAEADDTADLAKEAFEWYKDRYHTNGDEFDSDNDGYVDAICLIYNAPANYANNDNLWAYCYWRAVRPGTAKRPDVNAFFWASISFMNNSLDRQMIDAHTYIHELGHVMGLEDYYNYEDTNKGATGGFIMEDMNVGDHDPFSKMAFNWVTPTLVTGSTTVKLESFTETGQVLIFKPKATTMDSPFDEYLAVELYTPTNLNQHDSEHLHELHFAQGPKVPGLRIWHVDGRLFEFDIKNPNKASLTTTYEHNSYTKAYVTAMSNSTSGGNASINENYRQFKLLHALQQGGVNTYAQGATTTADDLWQAGDSFSMDQYRNFFYIPGRFNSGERFNMSLSVTSIENNVATIEVTL